MRCSSVPTFDSLKPVIRATERYPFNTANHVMLTVIGKDGGVKLRKPFPWDVRELSRSIDKMPLRQQEIRDAVQATE